MINNDKAAVEVNRLISIFIKECTPAGSQGE